MKLKRIICISILFCLPFLASLCKADILVIVHNENPVKAFEKQNISDLYLGRTRVFPDGNYALVFHQRSEMALHTRFVAGLTSMLPQEYKSYWSRLMFSGRTLPPQELPDDQMVLSIIKQNRSAIGYINATTHHEDVRVVLRIKASQH